MALAEAGTGCGAGGVEGRRRAWPRAGGGEWGLGMRDGSAIGGGGWRRRLGGEEEAQEGEKSARHGYFRSRFSPQLAPLRDADEKDVHELDQIISLAASDYRAPRASGPSGHRVCSQRERWGKK